ncbi:hypothetical protein PVAP13_8KG265800 [Panicum virgatum]|uniref:Uncharacterized protein n=1 Tax=Panicum virgatum TaxID=38727 RepID=A0A8T0PMU6_PANVG|nr:hypothetical protein PVAP13_8KG265800 [Panicum virgatum]
MPSGREATTFMALVALLLLSVMPTTTIAGAVAADEGTYVDYFLGDLFHNPEKKMEPKTLRFRPWQIFNVSGGGVPAFHCDGDAPTLRLVPSSDHPERVVSNIDGSLPQDTCGGGGGTPVQYKFSRPDKPTGGYSALFWARPAGGGDENGSPLMPVPKLQLKAILKALAAMMEAAWRGEKGEAMPESVPFQADTVAFYVKELGWLVIMGREDVEFRRPWERLERKMRTLTLGAAVV